MEFSVIEKIAIRIASGVARAYHGGSKLKGDNFDATHLGAGEGLSALGPGIYFASDIDIAKLYCKYVDKPYLYTVDLNTTDYYNPTTGEPEHLRGASAELEQELKTNLDKVRGVSYLNHGKRPFGPVVKLVGPSKARELFIKVGIRGAYENLPNNVIEYAVFDIGTIEIIDSQKI